MCEVLSVPHGGDLLLSVRVQFPLGNYQKENRNKCAESIALRLSEMINVCIRPNLERIVGHSTP
jgi:hypothetical protein